MDAGIDTSPYFTVRFDSLQEMYPNFTIKDWIAFTNHISNEMDEYLYQFDPDDMEDNE